MTSDNPQQRGIEPIRKAPGRYHFEPRKGMVREADDIDPAFEFEINEAIQDSEDRLKSKPSSANLGYASMKRSGR